jgi:hypothetical protein
MRIDIPRVPFTFILINSPKIVTTSICKIPPNLPFLKGGITPLWQRGVTCLREAASAKAGGRFSNAYVSSILRQLIT